jgi:hypothetical protein
MIDIALAKIDASIKMFKAYRPTPSTLATLASLHAERAELVAHAADSSKLSYAASMWLFEMPAWGYSGT